MLCNWICDCQGLPGSIMNRTRHTRDHFVAAKTHALAPGLGGANFSHRNMALDVNGCETRTGNKRVHNVKHSEQKCKNVVFLLWFTPCSKAFRRVPPLPFCFLHLLFTYGNLRNTGLHSIAVICWSNMLFELSWTKGPWWHLVGTFGPRFPDVF